MKIHSKRDRASGSHLTRQSIAIVSVCIWVVSECCPPPAAELRLHMIESSPQQPERKFLFVKRRCESSASLMNRLVRRLDLPDDSAIRIEPSFSRLTHHQTVRIERVVVKGCAAGHDLEQCVDSKLRRDGVALLDRALDVDMIEKCRAAFMPQLAQLLEKMLSCGVNRQQSFSFHEVCSRKYNRLDVHYGVNQCDQLVQAVQHQIGSLIERMLGGKTRLLQSGMLVNLPGSETQNWHTDGPHFANSSSVYALTVYVPLVDLEDAVGPTMYMLGSHQHEQLQQGAEATAILARRGGVVLWDYRTVHWGLPNKSLNTTRPVLYLAFGGPWFHDHDNEFPACSLFKDNCQCK